jgi:surface polysaccharide O-acyltransferase-like enzyme
MLLGQPYMQRYNPQVDTRYFAGYIGYLVLGYYLANKTINTTHIAWWLAALFMLSVAGITFGTWALYRHYNGISTLMYEPLSWPVVVLSSGMLLWIKNIQLKVPAWLIKSRDFTGKYNYGIYLAHALFLTLLDDERIPFNLSYKTFNPLFSIPLTALVCFALSLLLVYIVNKLPLVGKYISG